MTAFTRPRAAEAETIAPRLAAIAAKQSTIGLSVVDADSGREIFGHNEKLPLKPASVMKVLTAFAALKELGPDYRFRTRVLAEGIGRTSVDRLYVAGEGDPSLNTEALWLIARAVRRRGVRSVNRLLLDGSAFAENAARSGARAYQAGTSALSFNYNALAFEICPTAVGQPATVSPDPWESQVEVSGRVMTVAGRGLEIGIDESDSGGSCGKPPAFRLAGRFGVLADCQIVYRSMPCPAEYLGGVLRENLKLLGVNVRKNPQLGAAAIGARELYVHESKALSQIVEDMNHYSSNFAAEQLLTALDVGRERGKRREAGLARLRSILAAWGFSEPEFRLADGSGLSHDNRLSARIVTRVLLEARKDAQFNTEFEKSLAVGGRSGTLKRRTLVPPAVVVRAKTGTIDDVTGLAGYVRDGGGRLLAFALLQNGSAEQETKWGVEKQVLQAIIESL